MKFLDADVKRPLASVSAIVDEGNVVVFGQHKSFIENVSTGQRIPMCRRNRVLQSANKSEKQCVPTSEGRRSSWEAQLFYVFEEKPVWRQEQQKTFGKALGVAEHHAKNSGKHISSEWYPFYQVYVHE